MTDDGVGMPPDSGDVPIGKVLAQLRRRAKLTGHQLARRVDMSQAKISRIENGVGFTAPGDVEILARTLGAPQATIDRLVEQAERSNDRMTDWRPTRGAVANMQREVEKLEASTSVFRVFQPAVIVGLAQTSEYARSVISATHKIRTGVTAEGGFAAVPEAVSVRVRRQEILAEPGKEFHFVMAEAVLSNRFGRPEDMPAQIHRLRELAAQGNITLRIIPSDAELDIPPYHGFELLDDRCVIVDVFNTPITTRGQSDTALYRRLFDMFDSKATDDIEPILDRYLNFYLDQSRPGQSRRVTQA
jgi:transcriptional regulator with XRE-family HTH domain